MLDMYSKHKSMFISVVISNVVMGDIGFMLIFDKPDVCQLILDNMFSPFYLEHQVSPIVKLTYYYALLLSRWPKFIYRHKIFKMYTFTGEKTSEKHLINSGIVCK